MSKKARKRKPKKRAEPPARLLRTRDADESSLRADVRGIRAEVRSGLPVSRLPRDQRAVVAAANMTVSRERADAKRRNSRKAQRRARRAR